MANEKRLIDANALRERHCVGCNEDIREMCRVGPICASLLWVDEEPTVDAVEVVHGRWENNHCTNCGTHKPYDGDGLYWATNYCPNCGAKMDGDGNG